MDNTEQARIVNGVLKGLCMPLFVAKGREYTQGSEDVNANFKRQAEDWGLHPLQVWGVFANKHFASLKTYVQDAAAGKDPTPSEPIAGRIADMINYLLLLGCLIVDLNLVEGRHLLEVISLNPEAANGNN